MIEISASAQTYLHGLLDKQEDEGVSIRIFVAQPGTPQAETCLLYTSPSPRDGLLSRMPSSA